MKTTQNIRLNWSSLLAYKFIIFNRLIRMMFQWNWSLDGNFVRRGEAGEHIMKEKSAAGAEASERVRRACFSAHASQSDTGPEWWAQILEAEYPTAAERYYEYCVPGLIVFRYKSIGARSRAARAARTWNNNSNARMAAAWLWHKATAPVKVSS